MAGGILSEESGEFGTLRFGRLFDEFGCPSGAHDVEREGRFSAVGDFMGGCFR